jgi:hypothetical protein
MRAHHLRSGGVVRIAELKGDSPIENLNPIIGDICI